MRLCVRFLSVAAILPVVAICMVACSEKAVQMVLTFSPPDAKVTVDGYRPKTLNSPHTFHFYKPGSYRLEVAANGYVPVKMMISVEAGEVLTQTVHLVKEDEVEDTPNVVAVSKDTGNQDTGKDSVSTPLSIDPTAGAENEFVLNVNTEPQGATVVAQSKGMKSIVVHTPGRQVLPKAVPWHLTITKDGYKTQIQTVIGPANNDTVNLNVALAKTGSGTISPELASDLPRPPHPLVQLDEPPAPLPRHDTGFLTVRTTPQTMVSVDGKSIGSTPIVQYRLAPGNHKVLMENRERSKRRVQNIDIRVGEHIRINQTL